MELLTCAIKGTKLALPFSKLSLMSTNVVSSVQRLILLIVSYMEMIMQLLWCKGNLYSFIIFLTN